MFPGLGNPKQMQGMLKKMGISQEEVSAERVIIEKTDGNKIVIENPSVTKIKMQGNESFQISGDVSEIQEEPELFSEEDIKTIVEKTGVSEEIAKETLEKNNGDLAETILELSE
jgi:nascent polypeptide-associated complex subunit alpha